MSEGTITTGQAPAAVAPRAQAAPRTARIGRRLGAVWAGRGWWGGWIAFGLAAVGQKMSLTGGAPAIAGRYYWIGIILLIAVLIPPRLPGFPRSTPTQSPTPPPPATPSLPVRRA